MLSAVAAAVLAAVSLTVTTQNVRVSLPPAQARHDIAQAAEHSSLVVTQEMGKRHARRFAPAGWGTAHFSGLSRGDCATYWKRDRWTLRRSWAVQLTAADGFRHGHRWALVTVLRDHQTTVALVCLHMITRALDRRPVYRRGIGRLAQLLTRLHSHWPHVLVGGDWNLAWGTDHQLRLPGFPAVRLPAHGMRSWAPSRATGPQGGRVDFFYWRRHAITCTGLRIIGHTYSDHQGTRIHLRLHQ